MYFQHDSNASPIVIQPDEFNCLHSKITFFALKLITHVNLEPKNGCKFVYANLCQSMPIYANMAMAQKTGMNCYAVIWTYGTTELRKWSQMISISSKGYGSPVGPGYGSGSPVFSPFTRPKKMAILGYPRPCWTVNGRRLVDDLKLVIETFAGFRQLHSPRHRSDKDDLGRIGQRIGQQHLNEFTWCYGYLIHLQTHHIPSQAHTHWHTITSRSPSSRLRKELKAFRWFTILSSATAVPKVQIRAKVKNDS